MTSTDGLDRVDAWLKDWFPDTTFSRQDIREICRGPMKGILQDFLVPRFRTEDQTYVIRSNLYAHGKRADLPQPPGLDVEEEKLRKALGEVNREKDAALKNLLDKSEKLRELQEEQRQCDYTADSLGLKRRHIASLKETIHSTNAIIEDLKPLLVTDDVVYMEKEKQYESFQAIQDEAISLFQSMFMDGMNTDSDELMEMNSRIQKLIEHVVRGGLSSKEIVRWHKDELLQAKQILADTKSQFVKTDSSPCEELADEAEQLKQILTTQHIDLYNKAVKLTDEIETTAEDRKKTQMKVVEEHLGVFAPVDYLKFVRKEELKGKIKKCQEIQGQPASLCPSGNNLRSARNSIAMSDSKLPGTDISVTQEKLEDVTSGILRNWAATKGKLMDGVQMGREIIPEQFISALKEEPKNSQKGTYFYRNNGKLIPDVDEISACSGIEQQGTFSEPSMIALNPNTENWCLGSFVSKYNGSQRRRNDTHQDLASLWQQLEQSSAKTGRANLEILDQLIQQTKTNLNRFGPSS